MIKEGDPKACCPARIGGDLWKTAVGSGIAFLAKHTKKVFLSVSLGFSAGVMIYVSMIEIFVEAQTLLTAQAGAKAGRWLTVLAFFGGMLLIAVIDKLIPSAENPHEVKSVEAEQEGAPAPGKMMRTGVLTAVAIAVHNFPEGLATFVSALQEPGIAIPIVAAIAMHNIPEGIAVSVPIYQATGSKRKAFLYSFLSGLAEPAGALAAFFFLRRWISPLFLNGLVATIAGIMSCVAACELLPGSFSYDADRAAGLGFAGAEQTESGIDEVLFLMQTTGITWQGLIAFCVFNMLTVPCFAAAAVVKGETPKGRFKFTVAFWLLTSFVTATCLYLMFTWVWTVAIVAAVVALVVLFFVLRNRGVIRLGRKKNNTPAKE